jgi:hypothetical protein
MSTLERTTAVFAPAVHLARHVAGIPIVATARIDKPPRYSMRTLRCCACCQHAARQQQRACRVSLYSRAPIGLASRSVANVSVLARRTNGTAPVPGPLGVRHLWRARACIHHALRVNHNE